MQISDEGKIGIALALLGIGGGGALFVLPHPYADYVGWSLIGISVVGGIHERAGARDGNSMVPSYIPEMATIVQCNCGAEYRRIEEKFLVPHTGDAICAVCGAALESWSESTNVPIYELKVQTESRND